MVVRSLGGERVESGAHGRAECVGVCSTVRRGVRSGRRDKEVGIEEVQPKSAMGSMQCAGSGSTLTVAAG